MKEIRIMVDEDLHELLSLIAERKKTNIDKLVYDIVKSEAVKISWEITFTELEEAYEKERRSKK